MLLVWIVDICESLLIRLEQPTDSSDHIKRNEWHKTLWFTGDDVRVEMQFRLQQSVKPPYELPEFLSLALRVNIRNYWDIIR